MNEYLDFAKDLAQDAGRIMMKYFQAEELGLEVKLDNSPVTLADKEINSLVISRVQKRFPDHGVMGEEESYNLEREGLWIVDPLDGTANFAKGIPVAAFSIAFTEKGQPKTGVVYDPFTDRLFYASKGSGAYENDRLLDLSSYKRPSRLEISSWVAGNINGTIFKDGEIDGRVLSVYGRQGDIVSFDLPIAYALAMAAAGRFDAAITSCKNPWDLAAGSLIAMESGAKVTDLFGNNILMWSKDISGMLIAPPVVHEYLLDIVKPILAEAERV